MAKDENTEHDDLLTDEERAAMEAEEGEEIDGSASLTGEDTKEWVDNGWGAHDMSAGNDTVPAEDGDDTIEAGQGDDTTESAQGDDTVEAGQDDPDKEQREQNENRQENTPPVDLREFDGKLEALQTKEQELLDQYDDGDLTREEFLAERKKIQDESTQIVEERAIAKKQVADDDNRWKEALKSYRGDYEGLFDKENVAAFDAEVRAVTSNPALANKSFREQLSIAHKRLLSTAEDYGLDNVPEMKGQKKPDPKGDPKPEQGQQQGQRDARGDDLRTPPKTLAHVPASDITDSGDSKYAALQRIVDNGTPEEVEEAMAKLSPDERDRFASSIV